MFTIRMGVPQMEEYWFDLKEKDDSGNASEKERRAYRKLGKALHLLAINPRHSGLNSHEIKALSSRYGMKVWESYLENNTPAAGRFFWVYGPGKGDITILGVEPHPNDKASAYNRITLSSVGKEIR